MSGEKLSLVERLTHRSALARWRRAAAQAEQLTHAQLRDLRAMGSQLTREIDGLVTVADRRLTRTLPPAPPPLGSDWSWQPDAWARPLRPAGKARVENGETLAPGLRLFHDCAESTLTFRQTRRDLSDGLQFGLQVEGFAFSGSFLSLSLEFPEEAARGLRLRHLVRFDAVILLESPVETFARLNIRHGPNTEQVLRELDFRSGPHVSAEFDLAFTKLNEKRIEKAWLDIIFDRPQNNSFTLSDVQISRRNRAEV